MDFKLYNTRSKHLSLMDFKLCDNMVIEILSRTSLKTLDTIRCTSKELEKLTYEWYLFVLYKQRNNIVSGFLVQTNNKSGNYINELAPSCGSNNIDLGFLPRNARILASSEQGIIVFESPHPKTHKLISYCVCKPTSKQILAIPNPRTKYFTEKVAMVVVGSNPLHYKILRLSSRSGMKTRNELHMKYRCEIFDSTTWAWKLLDLVMLPYGVFLTNPQPITTRGIVYMLLTNNDILKFDASSERWTTFSSPVSTLDCESSQLIKHEGKLGFACKPSVGCWEIWVLGIDDSWEKIQVYNEEDDINAKKSFDDPNKSVMVDLITLLFYKGNTIDKVVLSNRSDKMFIYRSDFEPTNLTGRQK